MIGPGKKKKQKTSLNLVLLQWAGLGDKLIWRHAGDKELEKNAKRFNKDVQRLFLKDPLAQ